MFQYRRYLWQSRKQMWHWTLRRRSIRDGFVGGNILWLVVGFAVHGRRMLRRLTRSEPELVATARLEPGQSLSIRTIDPRSEPGA